MVIYACHTTFASFCSLYSFSRLYAFLPPSLCFGFRDFYFHITQRKTLFWDLGVKSSKNDEHSLGVGQKNLISHLSMRKLFIHAISQESTPQLLHNGRLR